MKLMLVLTITSFWQGLKCWDHPTTNKNITFFMLYLILGRTNIRALERWPIFHTRRTHPHRVPRKHQGRRSQTDRPGWTPWASTRSTSRTWRTQKENRCAASFSRDAARSRQREEDVPDEATKWCYISAEASHNWSLWSYAAEITRRLSALPEPDIFSETVADFTTPIKRKNH